MQIHMLRGSQPRHSHWLISQIQLTDALGRLVLAERLVSDIRITFLGWGYAAGARATLEIANRLSDEIGIIEKALAE